MAGEVDAALLVEAALFAAGRPMSVEEISEATGLEVEEVESVIPRISESLKGRPYFLQERPDGLFMTLRPEYREVAERVSARPELSRAELRTLAVISALGPLSLSRLAELRGSSAYAHVKKLRKKGLIYVKRAGRGRVVGVTRDFRRFFEPPGPELIKGAGGE